MNWDAFCKSWLEVGRKLRKRERNIKRWQDPVLRQLTLEKKRIYRQNPLVLERERESQRRRKPWLKPEAIERKRKLRRDPEYKEQRKLESYTILARCKRYGISVLEFWECFNAQGGHCLFCDFTFEGVSDSYCPRFVNFDHDHKTDKFRGLLCTGCNTTVGYVEKAVRLKKLKAILEYVGVNDEIVQEGFDGGPKSTVTGYWLAEFKRLFSVVLLKFGHGSRDEYHSHAFTSINWVLRGKVVEHDLDGTMKVYKPSLCPVVTRRRTFHRVVSEGTTWVFSLRGPWAKWWVEWSPITGQFKTLTGGRREV